MMKTGFFYGIEKMPGEIPKPETLLGVLDVSFVECEDQAIC